MQWEEIWKMLFAVILSFGGAGTIIAAVVKFSSQIIADRLSKNYELKLNKELETIKAKLEGKSYISKTRFDAEFQIYRKLSEVTVNMVKEVRLLFPRFTRDMRNDHDINKKRYDAALSSVVEARDILSASAPFISEDIYIAFSSLEGKCNTQLGDFIDFRLRPDSDEFVELCPEEYHEVWKRTTKIEEELDIIISKLRSYLSTLDVLE